MTDGEIRQRIEDDNYSNLSELEKLQMMNYITEHIVKKIISSEKE